MITFITYFLNKVNINLPRRQFCQIYYIPYRKSRVYSKLLEAECKDIVRYCIYINKRRRTENLQP